MPAILDYLRAARERAERNDPARILRACNGNHAVAYGELRQAYIDARTALDGAVKHVERLESVLYRPACEVELQPEGVVRQ